MKSHLASLLMDSHTFRSLSLNLTAWLTGGSVVWVSKILDMLSDGHNLKVQLLITHESVRATLMLYS